MELADLLINQEIIVQLAWGERKIEFTSHVIEKESSEVYVSPYIHNGSPLEIDVTPDRDVACNIFTDNPSTKQRISWKGIELETQKKDGDVRYCLRTRGYNKKSNLDDRRLHDRIVIQVKARVEDAQSGYSEGIIVHDISDIGISFYASDSFKPKSQQFIITFTDSIDEKEFNVRVECVGARMISHVGNNFFGCKVLGENKDYQLYVFMKQLLRKNSFKAQENVTTEAENDADESGIEEATEK